MTGKLTYEELEQRVMELEAIEMDRRRVEQELAKAEEKWRSITENSPDFIMVLDTEGIIQFINRSPYQPKEQVVGSSMLDLTDERHKPAVKELLERVRRTGQPGCGEALYLSPGGTSRLFEVRIGPVFDAGRVVALILNGTDITDRKRMQEEIARTQQLESIGVLAGGIAHDLNNILTPILANISTARMYGEFDDEIAELLTDSERATVRAKGLTQQLLTFARGGEPIIKTMQVSKSIRESAKFALSGSSARCEFSLPESLWLVDADATQLSQVIQNVVINAEQAMAAGGVIKISAENLILKDDPLVSTEDGKCVRISIEDQGCGIPDKQLSKIFDPFFTTKERGRGLGLSTSFSIVKRHGGHMKVSSEVGVGTRLDIYLPASKKTSVSQEGERPKPARGEGRVLIIDDEDTVRRSASMILKRLGFEVEEAGNGQEGITLYRKAKELGRPFCAVVMDLTIPGGMGGKRAIQKLMEMDPQARVIVSSGYSDDPVLSNFRDYGFSGVLTKPYNAEELGMVLHKAISEI